MSTLTATTEEAITLDRCERFALLLRRGARVTACRCTPPEPELWEQLVGSTVPDRLTEAQAAAVEGRPADTNRVVLDAWIAGLPNSDRAAVTITDQDHAMVRLAVGSDVWELPLGAWDPGQWMALLARICRAGELPPPAGFVSPPTRRVGHIYPEVAVPAARAKREARLAVELRCTVEEAGRWAERVGVKAARVLAPAGVPERFALAASGVFGGRPGWEQLAIGAWRAGWTVERLGAWSLWLSETPSLVWASLPWRVPLAWLELIDSGGERPDLHEIEDLAERVPTDTDPDLLGQLLLAEITDPADIAAIAVVVDTLDAWCDLVEAAGLDILLVGPGDVAAVLAAANPTAG